MNDDKLDLSRIIANYQMMGQIRQYSDYSIHWESFHLENYNSKNFIDEEQIRNFRQNLSSGRDDSHSRKHYITDESIDEWKSEIGAEFLEYYLNEKNIGNSIDCKLVGNKYYDYNQLFQIYYARHILDNITLRDKVVWEIGGGYGALAQILMRGPNRPAVYIFTDLPEANIQAAYFLQSHFPNYKIGLDLDFPNQLLTKENLELYDIIIVSPEIEFSESLKVDLVINVRSMMEMEMAVIDKYFDKINKHVSYQGSLFCCNRYEKNTVGQTIKISDFRFGPYWNVEISQSCFKQPHIHMLLLSRSIDPGDIVAELINVEYLGKEFREPQIVRMRYQIEFWFRKIAGRYIYIKTKGLIRLIKTKLKER